MHFKLAAIVTALLTTTVVLAAPITERNAAADESTMLSSISNEARNAEADSKKENAARDCANYPPGYPPAFIVGNCG